MNARILKFAEVNIAAAVAFFVATMKVSDKPAVIRAVIDGSSQSAEWREKYGGPCWPIAAAASAVLGRSGEEFHAYVVEHSGDHRFAGTFVYESARLLGVTQSDIWDFIKRWNSVLAPETEDVADYNLEVHVHQVVLTRLQEHLDDLFKIATIHDSVAPDGATLRPSTMMFQ